MLKTIILLLALSTPTFAASIPKEDNVKPAVVTIICVDGYKYIIVRSGEYGAVAVTQMLKSSLPDSTTQAITCNK